MRSQKRLKLQLIDGKIRIQSSHNQVHTAGTESFCIVIREKGRMEIPIKIVTRKG
jgi:hypothetical protein